MLKDLLWFAPGFSEDVEEGIEDGVVEDTGERDGTKAALLGENVGDSALPLNLYISYCATIRSTWPGVNLVRQKLSVEYAALI